jgi:hypothetical protein
VPLLIALCADCKKQFGIINDLSGMVKALQQIDGKIRGIETKLHQVWLKP